jgi:hypothetical protein
MNKIKKALRLFASRTATRSQRHHNVRQYLKALEYMGDSWLLAKPIELKKIVKATHKQ